MIVCAFFVMRHDEMDRVCPFAAEDLDSFVVEEDAENLLLLLRRSDVVVRTDLEHAAIIEREVILYDLIRFDLI
jgi:hypothetical protein